MHSLLRLGTVSLFTLALAGSLHAQGLRPAAPPNAGAAAPRSAAGVAANSQAAAQDTNDNPLGLGPNTPTVQIPIMTPGAAVEAGYAQTARVQPFPELTDDERQFLDDVLNVWEQRTAVVNQFQCDFKRWQYDPNQHATAPVTIASGIIKFSKPDKGLLRVDELRSVTDNTSPTPQYQTNPRREFGEYWICDGSWVHDLDRNEKKAVRRQLPPEMRGNQIHHSPLPFLFGVKADEIKQRYFVRTVTPPAGNNDVWVEAWPKRPDDAGNYSRVQIVLDRVDVLPKTMIVFMPNWTADKKHREVYEFENRDLVDGLLNKVKQHLFNQDFISTRLGGDWEVTEVPWIEPGSPASNAADPNLRTANPNQPVLQNR